MTSVLVVSPHPDDETLGCGGTLLRHAEEGCSLSWLIMTGIAGCEGVTTNDVDTKQKIIREVGNRYKFKQIKQLSFAATNLDAVPLSQIIAESAKFVAEVEPDILYLPFRNDAHTDHKIVFDAMASFSKSFRYPFIRSVRAYETLSETEFGIAPGAMGFRPNLWIEITDQLESKIDIMKLYNSEMGKHPFPRSINAIRALATLRGATAGCDAAEAFMILKETVLYAK